MLLESIGGRVDTTLSLGQAERSIRESRPYLLVLCYTLAPADRDAMLSAASALHPPIKTLTLRADGLASGPTKEETFSIFSGAAALRAKVEEMLGPQPVLMTGP